MASTILGMFEHPLEARRAMDRLRDSSLRIDDISIISRATESGKPISSVDDVSAGEGAAVGAVWGGLVGLATLLIPGIGPFIALGALAATLTGAVTGAVVGGIAAALIDFGDIPEDEARAYEAKIHAGATLIAVKVHPDDTAETRRLLVDAGANSLYDNQTDVTSGDRPAQVRTDDAVSESKALEYGAPSNPTTIDREPTENVRVDPSPNASRPVVEDSITARDPLLMGNAGILPADSGPPELREDIPDATTPDTSTLPRDAWPDTNIPPEDEEKKRKI
jgi:uncharacterized membrane protein